METIIISVLFILLVTGAYLLSLEVKKTREKMFKEMEELEAEEELAKAENLQRFEKRFEPVKPKEEPKPEPAPETKPVEEDKPAVSKPKKKKPSGRRGRPAKPKGDA